MPLTLASLALALAVQDPPRLRSVLPNDAVVLVEPMAHERLVSVQLWASAKGVPESATTHGHRHLLEHVLALGSNRDLDARLETEGGFLRARTYRDATQLEILIPPAGLETAFNAVTELLQPLRLTADELDRERKVIEMELRLRSKEELLSAAAWHKAYGDAGLDPLGSPDGMASATPQSLEALRAKHFAPAGLALVVAGPVPLSPTVARARRVLEGVKAGPKPKIEERQPKTADENLTPVAGYARAARVPGMGSLETASTLAAALAIASEMEGAFVTYTPTSNNAVITVGGEFIDFRDRFDALSPANANALFGRGKLLARAWVDRPLKTASGTAWLRGMMICQGIGYKPEMMLDAIASMKQSDFAAAIAKFRESNAIVVGGAP